MARYSNLFIKKVYRQMLRIRQFEKSLIPLIESGKIETPCHLCIGQEAVAVGVCEALNKEDVVFGNHRSHGHYLAKGGNMNALAAEIYGKETGCSKGRGGSMHIIDIEAGFMGSVPIIAGTIPIATGAAFKFKLDNESRISVSFFGDGATNEGVLYESMNFAALHNLPIIFVCENNQYATHVKVKDHCGADKIRHIAEPFMLSYEVNGNNVFNVNSKTKQLIEACKRGEGPFFLECHTYRMCGHVGPDDNILGEHLDIRPIDEIEYWSKKDPLKDWENYISEYDMNRINAEVVAAHKFAEESKWPDDNELGKYLFK